MQKEVMFTMEITLDQCTTNEYFTTDFGIDRAVIDLAAWIDDQAIQGGALESGDLGGVLFPVGFRVTALE